MATSPETSLPWVASNTASLNKIIRVDTTESTTSTTVPDMVGHPLAEACSQWEWLKAAVKSQVGHDNKPIQCHAFKPQPNRCRKQCQQCELLLQAYLNTDLANIWRDVHLSWGSTGKVSVLRFKLNSGGPCIILSAIENTPNPWDLQGRLPSAESTGSSASVRLARRWLDDCINNHPSCGSTHDPVLPTRVLDLGLDSSTRVSLWEPRGRTGRYVCLSYCWGKNEFTMTTQDNIKHHMEGGIDLKDLPKTFQDAVAVVRGLKIQYLWIDALCIIQNEDNHEDWKRECGNMASIYRNSDLTVAAAWANSASGGCFTTPDPGVAFETVMMRKVSHFASRSDSADFPMLARAWTFQERLLAPRVIYFCRQEIVWDCIEMRTCECGGVTNPVPGVEKLDLDNQGDTGDVGELWRRLVIQYSRLQLTCPNDKLPALSGLAQAMTLRSQENYLAGLWKETLLGDMCWSATYPRPEKPHQTTWRAPSWSWASVDGPIDYYADLSTEAWIRSFKDHALVCEAKCTPAGPSLTGEVEDGFVTLDGFLIPASFGDSGISANCSELESYQLTWIPDWAYDMEEMPVIYLVPIMTIWNGIFSHFYGIVVKPHGQGVTMTRVGLASHVDADNPGGFNFFDCEKQIVKIV